MASTYLFEVQSTLRCRLCACTGRRTKKLVFEDGHKTPWHKKIESRLQISLLFHDELPAHICTECQMQLAHLDTFTKQVYANQELFAENLKNPYYEILSCSSMLQKDTATPPSDSVLKLSTHNSKLSDASNPHHSKIHSKQSESESDDNKDFWSSDEMEPCSDGKSTAPSVSLKRKSIKTEDSSDESHIMSIKQEFLPNKLSVNCHDEQMDQKIQCNKVFIMDKKSDAPNKAASKEKEVNRLKSTPRNMGTLQEVEFANMFKCGTLLPGTCRLCACSGDEESEQIVFKDQREVPLYKKVQVILKIRLLYHYSLPTAICSECQKKLSDLDDFMQCVYTNQELFSTKLSYPCHQIIKPERRTTPAPTEPSRLRNATQVDKMQDSLHLKSNPEQLCPEKRSRTKAILMQGAVGTWFKNRNVSVYVLPTVDNARPAPALNLHQDTPRVEMKQKLPVIQKSVEVSNKLSKEEDVSIEKFVTFNNLKDQMNIKIQSVLPSRNDIWITDAKSGQRIGKKLITSVPPISIKEESSGNSAPSIKTQSTEALTTTKKGATVNCEISEVRTYGKRREISVPCIKCNTWNTSYLTALYHLVNKCSSKVPPNRSLEIYGPDLRKQCIAIGIAEATFLTKAHQEIRDYLKDIDNCSEEFGTISKLLRPAVDNYCKLRKLPFSKCYVEAPAEVIEID